MEVADSHMLEQSSTFTPSSHVDIDMSADYYDEEYMMHDAHPTTEVVDDEEIYDAEIEEQTGHTEVEMDDYTDQLAGDNESYMGTYVPADDATTDVIVEDVHLASSPAVSGTPRALSPHPDAAHAISQHVESGADSVINVTAPTEPLSSHSPQSVATLVGDSEPALLDDENEKVDHTLHEVIDLTANDSIVDLTADDDALNDPELAHTEFYEEEEDTPTVISPPQHHIPIADESTEVEGESDAIVANGTTENIAATLRDSEPVEQDDQPDESRHSPIEDALVLNQQVRDDAADTMEPSPPIRLLYDDNANGVSKIFDIFAPIDPSSSDADVLFAENRTLFYDPLSAFFVRLRETDYFLDSDWQNAEMALSIELGGHKLTITEDHKQTDDISLFKLYFIWSGFGLENPLRLTLQKYPSRFSIQYAQLIGHLEQRGLHGDGADTEGLHEVDQHEDQATETNYGANYHAGDNRTDDNGAAQQAPLESHDGTGAHASGKGSGAHEDQGVEDMPSDVNAAEPFGETDSQHGVGDTGGEGDRSLSHSGLNDEDLRVDNVQIDVQAANVPVPASPNSDVEPEEPSGDQEGDGDLYDEYDEEYTTSEATSVQRGKPVQVPDAEYDEYEEAEQESHLTSDKKNVADAATEGAGEHDDHSENYGDYEDTNEEGNNEDSTSGSPLQVSANLQRTESSTKATSTPPSPSRHLLKRNLDDFENADQERSSSAALPALLAETKRAKHA